MLGFTTQNTYQSTIQPSRWQATAFFGTHLGNWCLACVRCCSKQSPLEWWPCPAESRAECWVLRSAEHAGYAELMNKTVPTWIGNPKMIKMNGFNIKRLAFVVFKCIQDWEIYDYNGTRNHTLWHWNALTSSCHINRSTGWMNTLTWNMKSHEVHYLHNTLIEHDRSWTSHVNPR